MIATLARRHAARGEPVEVVTGDRDLIQLVDDATGVRVLYTGRGIRRVEVLDEAAVIAAHGVRPQQYTDLAILRGDPSDGLPGVPGIGAKTAAGLLARFSDMAGILRAIEADDSGGQPADHRGAATTTATTWRGPSRWCARRMCRWPRSRCGSPTGRPTPPGSDALAERWGIAAPIERLQDALAASGCRDDLTRVSAGRSRVSPG